MGPELRKVADTIMSDLGMGEDQGKIDALEQYLEENLSLFFSEDSYMSSVIKMGAEKSFTSHSAKIKDFLTRGIGGGTIMEGATPTGTSSSPISPPRFLSRSTRGGTFGSCSEATQQL